MDPIALITPAITAVQTGLSGVAGPALLVGAGVLALTVGWKFAKRFVRG